MVEDDGFLNYKLNSWFDVPAPLVTNIEAVTTQSGQKSTENTISIDINPEYFKDDENGKQVFFGVVVCAESMCIGKVYIKEIF